MKISLPEGYQLPENAVPGEPFEVVAVISQEEDGTFELKSIDGVELPEMEDEDETEMEGGPPPMVMPWNQESTLE
jgi:hypothetical protein